MIKEKNYLAATSSLSISTNVLISSSPLSRGEISTSIGKRFCRHTSIKVL